jgi:DNA replication protein DnaC
MDANYRICKGYADTFGDASGSILMIGGTGLGKTHLSTAIAAQVIDKGYDVQYVTAQNLISDFSYERYHRSFSDNSKSKSDKYFECELLIIDDFGTEENNQFSSAVFYNLINSRSNSAKKTIINTNIRQSAIAERYTDRVASRLFGEYTVLVFPGKDIRMQKLMQ